MVETQITHELHIPENEARRTYSVYIDIQAYRDLNSQKAFITEDEFTQRQQALNSLIDFNLQSSLAERYNAEQYRANYYLESGQIIHPSFNAPFLEIIKKGQKFRKEHGSHDLEREEAERVGFEKVQNLLADPELDDPERKIIVISPRGSENSIYQHNFFDVYSKGASGQIAMSRFTCKFDHSQFREAVQQIDPFCEIQENPTDADFLSSPLVTYKNMEEILETFSPQEDTIPLERLQELNEACTNLRLIYINALCRELSERKVKEAINALIKFSDIVTGRDIQKHTEAERAAIVSNVKKPFMLPMLITQLATQPIRVVSTGCGKSGGYGMEQNWPTSFSLLQPFSVSEFALPDSLESNEKVEDFTCPGTKPDGSKCTYIVRAYSGVKKCPECGTGATCA